MDIIPILVVIGCVYVVKGTIVIIISSNSFVVFCCSRLVCGDKRTIH